MANIEAKAQTIYTFDITELTKEDMLTLEDALREYYNCHNGEFSPQHPLALNAKKLYSLVGNELRARNV
jgi:hypothetical protein